MAIDIAKEEFARIGEKTTICCLTLDNGFEVIGSSACVDPADFDVEAGRTWARKVAMDRLEEFEGFVRQQELQEGI